MDLGQDLRKTNVFAWDIFSDLDLILEIPFKVSVGNNGFSNMCSPGHVPQHI